MKPTTFDELPRLYPITHLINRAHNGNFHVDVSRPVFERDRDRILYSTVFRRLSGKTQVFLSRAHDHIRTRLTHTLEVSAISRDLAKRFKLDETLSEAIALGHDIGHTPFGHVGERTLCLLMNNCDELFTGGEISPCAEGFKHNWQSVRVASKPEALFGDAGLNLTNFTLWGMMNHSGATWKTCPHKEPTGDACYLDRTPRTCKRHGLRLLGFYEQYNAPMYAKHLEHGRIPAWSFEGQVVKIADEIAQRNHDVMDAVYMNIINCSELYELIRSHFFDFLDNEPYLSWLRESLSDNKTNQKRFLTTASSFINAFLKYNLAKNSKDNLLSFCLNHNIYTRDDFKELYETLPMTEVRNLINYHPDLAEKEARFQQVLKNRILNSYEVQRMDGMGNFIIRGLFKAFLNNPRQLPNSALYSLFKPLNPNLGNFGETSEIALGQIREEVNSASFRANPEKQQMLLRTICDYVSGMTDNYAINEYQKLYGHIYPS
jgi:dGTPase